MSSVGVTRQKQSIDDPCEGAAETRLRILVVTPELPFPPSWGFGTRVYQLARHLARRHDVTMLCLAPQHAGRYVQSLADELAALRTVPLPPAPSRRARRWSQARSMVSPAPFMLTDGSTRELQASLDHLVRTQQFDILQIEGLALSNLQAPAALPVVLDEHNIEYELVQRMANGERSAPRRMYNRLEFAKLRHLERRVWHTVDGCALTSEREELMVRSAAPSTPTATVPNGVDIDFFAPWPAPPEPDTLVFTGHLGYRPNTDAVHHLIDDIFPLIRQERPVCSLTIVGGGADDSLLARRAPGINFTDWVPDIRPYLARASVVVAPIRMGGGTRLKIVEALSMAKPVVSTTIGCEGIDVRHAEHLLVGDSAEAFAEHVVQLLERPDEARQLGARGAAIARTEYSWSRAAGALEQLHLKLARARA